MKISQLKAPFMVLFIVLASFMIQPLFSIPSNTLPSVQQEHQPDVFYQHNQSGPIENLEDIESEPFRTDNGLMGWKIEIPGRRPLATPAYYNNMVYVGGGYGSYEFYAFDAITGNLEWAIRTQDDGPTAAIVYRGRVLFNTESCTIYCVDAKTGEIYWEKWLGDPLMNQPAVYGDKVFMAFPDNDGRHKLAAMDFDTGAILWKTALSTDIISAPIVYKESVFVSAMEGTVYRIDQEDGKIVWQEKKQATSAPWIENDEIYVSIREATQDNGTQQNYEGIANMRQDTGHQENQELWSRQRADHYLFQENRDRQMLQSHMDASVGFGTAPSTAGLDKVTGNIGVIDNVMAGWSYQGSRPVVLNDRTYSAMGSSIQCINNHSGEVEWQKTIEENYTGRFLTPPAIIQNTIYMGTVKGEVMGINIHSGQKLFTIKLEGPVIFQPSVMDGWMFVGTENGLLYGINLEDKNATGWGMWGGNAQHNGWME